MTTCIITEVYVQFYGIMYYIDISTIHVHLYDNSINNVLSFMLPRPKMCNNYFMSGEIKGIKKNKIK